MTTLGLVLGLLDSMVRWVRLLSGCHNAEGDAAQGLVTWTARPVAS